METGAVSLLCMDVQGLCYKQQLAETQNDCSLLMQDAIAKNASRPLMRSLVTKVGSRLLMQSAIATLCQGLGST